MNWDSKERKIYKKAIIDGIEYRGDSIVEIDIHKSIIDDDTLKIGSVVSSRCSIRLKISSSIAINAKVEPFISLDNTNWEQLGVFYIDNRTKDGDFLNLTCFDKIYEAGKQFVLNTNIPMTGRRFSAPTYAVEIFNDICSVLGIQSSYSFIENDISKSYNLIPSYTMTMRDMLAELAITQGGCFKINRYGVLELVRFNGSAKKTYDRSLYSSCQEINVMKDISSVLVNDFDSISYQGPYRLGTNTTEESRVNSYFLNQDISNWNNLISSQLPIRYAPISMTTRGDPNIVVGDKISIVLKNGFTVETYVLKSHLKIKFGLSQVIESPSDTIQESEFGRFDILEQIKKAKDDIERVDEDIKQVEDEIDVIDESITNIGGNISDLEISLGQTGIEVGELGTRADRVEDELGINPDDEGKLFKLTMSGNAEEGVHYLLLIGDDTQNFPRDQIPWGTIVKVNPIGTNRIYINGKYRQIGISLRIWGDTELNISTNVADSLNMPKIWIESQDPTNEGEDGDIWVVI